MNRLSPMQIHDADMSDSTLCGLSKSHATFYNMSTANCSTNTALHGQETQFAPIFADEMTDILTEWTRDGENNGSLSHRLPRVRGLGYALGHLQLLLVHI
jgi:hypothetical protein